MAVFVLDLAQWNQVRGQRVELMAMPAGLFRRLFLSRLRRRRRVTKFLNGMSIMLNENRKVNAIARQNVHLQGDHLQRRPGDDHTRFTIHTTQSGGI